MKKTVILLLFIALIAFNKNINAQVSKNNKVLWAENVESVVPLEIPFKGDSAAWYDKDNKFKLNWYRLQFTPIQIWNVALKYDKEKMFSSITRAVLSGKLKAYTDYPNQGTELTLKEFNNILVKWDTTDTPMTAYDRNGGSGEMPIETTIKDELRPDEITQLKFNETIEFDTVSYTLIKKISRITFYTAEITERGERIGNDKEIFYVKLNDLPNKQK